MLNLRIIGSTRPGRAADWVVPWITTMSREHGAFDVEVLDLQDWQLPLFGETLATVGDPKNPAFSQPVVKQWNSKIAEGDAYLFVTPEYNHSIPGVLKTPSTVSSPPSPSAASPPRTWATAAARGVV